MILPTKRKFCTAGRRSDCSRRGHASARRRLWAGLPLAMLLAACDGGLFGTGDPDVELNAEGSVGITTGLDGDLTDGATGDVGDTGGGTADGSTANGGTTDGSDGTGDGTQVPVGSDTGASGATDGATSGTDDGDVVGGADGDSQTAAPLSLTLGNYTNLGLSDVPHLQIVFTDELATDGVRSLVISGLPATAEAIDSGELVTVTSGDSATIALVPGDNRLSVSLGDDSVPPDDPNSTPLAEPVAALRINAVAGSLSTLLVATAGSDGAIGAMLLPNSAPSGDSQIARVRLVQLSTLGDRRVAEPWRLQSTGDNPGGVDTQFDNVGWMRLPPAYQDLPAGDYALLDATGRISPQNVRLQGGAVYTLVVVPSAETPLRLQRDDRLTGAP